MNDIKEVAREVLRIPTGISNCYMVGTQRRWTLIDTGTPGYTDKVVQIAEEHFGRDARPEAIVLTHGHFDHAGCAAALADRWNVTVLAHRLELPFVDGRSKYPPPDPVVGGFFAQVMRVIPNKQIDLGVRVEEFSSSDLPGLEEWEWLHTPGHTPGHVSFFRREDSTLIAGDAFTTVDQQSAYKVISRKKEVCIPPPYYTSNWDDAEQSVRRLADLKPRVLAAGHGEPMSGVPAIKGLERLARNFRQLMPDDGRYVREPAQTDEDGISYLPPKAPDPVGRVLNGVGVAAVGAGVLFAVSRRRKAA